MSRSRSEAADVARVARCRSGDGQAVEELYARYARSCLALARSVLADGHLAEDAVQEAFLELWRHPERFESGQSSVRGWLLLLTHRKAVDRVRFEQRRKTCELLPGHDHEDERPGPEAQVITTLAGDRARAALAALPAAKREALVLAYWCGYTQVQISRFTATPVGTVKSRMHGAMKELSSSLLDEASPRGSAAPRRVARRSAPDARAQPGLPAFASLLTPQARARGERP